MSSYEFVEAKKAEHPVRMLCRSLGISRAAYYAWRRGATHAADKDQRLVVHLRAAHRESQGTYGSPRLTAQLKQQGLAVGRRRVARVMKEQGLSGVPKKRFVKTTHSEHDDPVAPNRLDRDFTAEHPNQAWVTDITYIQTRSGWAYLAVIVDLFSRKVVGWALKDHMETSLCLTALERALRARQRPTGTLHHSDRGCQYTSGAYRAALDQAGFTQSMSRKGNCWDNAVAESFFGTLKQERVKKTIYANTEAARADISSYIHGFYNTKRKHSHLGQMSPIEFEQLHQQAERLVA